MFDGKILTAVFATLAAVAAALNGGSLDPGQLESSTFSAPGDATFNQVVPESFKLGDFLKNPEPENRVSATFQQKDLKDTELSLKSGRMEVDNLSSFDIGTKSVTSNSTVLFYGFKGKISPGEKTEIKGRVKGFKSEPVNFSGRFRVEKELNTGIITLSSVKRSKIRLKDVTGTVDSNTSVTEIRDPATDLRINSFSGDARIFPGNRTVTIDGHVDRLNAGDISLGSD